MHARAERCIINCKILLSRTVRKAPTMRQEAWPVNKFTMSNLALLMSYKVSAKEIEKIIDKLEIIPADNLYAVSSESANIASLQVLVKRYSSLSDYIVDMNLYVADAVNRRAQLVCFPAHTGLLPVSLVPQAEKSVVSLRSSGEEEIDPAALHKILSYFSDFAFEAYFQTMAALAARHRIYIAAGSTLYFEEDELRHRAFLFNHKGDLAGYQDKLALSKLEHEMGIEPAGELKLFDTPVGLLSILTGSDADYFELARIAKNLGAQLLLCPGAFKGEYTPIMSTLGLNMRVQESKLYGVQSALVGDPGLGFSMEGGCAIFAPNEMVKRKNGIVARASGGFEPDVVCAPLNLDRLELIQNPYHYDKNRDFMHKYVDRLY